MGYDFVIIKKEALEKPPVPPAASFIVPPNFQQTMPAQPSAAAATAPPSPAHSTSPAPKPVLPAPAKSGGSSHPPLKCSVAGTFYRSPAPSEPPFVKVWFIQLSKKPIRFFCFILPESEKHICPPSSFHFSIMILSFVKESITFLLSWVQRD